MTKIQEFVEKLRPHAGDHKIEIRPFPGKDVEYMKESEFLASKKHTVVIHTKGQFHGTAEEIFAAVAKKYPVDAA